MKATILISLFCFIIGVLLMRSCGKSLVFDEIQNERIDETEGIVKSLQNYQDSVEVVLSKHDSLSAIALSENDSLALLLEVAEETIIDISSQIKNNIKDEESIDNYILLSTADDDAEWAISYFRKRLGSS